MAEFNIKLIADVAELRRKNIIRFDTEIAEKTGYGRATLSNYLSGRVRASEPFIRKFYDTYGNKLAANNVSHETQTKSKQIPFYDVDVSAGAVKVYDDNGEHPAFFASIPGFEDCDFGARIYGHSMYPTYPAGIYIVCKRISNLEIIPYGECFLVITDEFRMAKRLLKSKYKGYVLASSDNEEIKNGVRVFDNFELPKDKIRKLYLIKGQVRKDQI
jgi:transcriptional regulator with XRE-family HTH domain